MYHPPAEAILCQVTVIRHVLVCGGTGPGRGDKEDVSGSSITAVQEAGDRRADER